jgi:ribonuclease R
MAKLFEGVTIDPAGAQDLDDAIWVSRDETGWTVQVAFPYLLDAIPPGERIDQLARKNLTTLYRPSGAPIHMLPDGIVLRSSLTPERRKDVFLVTIRLGQNFKAERVTCEITNFKSAGRLSYDEASEMIRTREGPFAEMLLQAQDLAYGLFETRRASGAIAYYDLERGVAYDEEGGVILMTGEGHVAEMIVSEMMILTNTVLAGWASNEGIPILFRNHQQGRARTREDVLASLGNIATDADVNLSGLQRLMPRAKIGIKAEGHYSLNLPAYAWFTSPLRRYADLVNQRMLAAHLADAPSPHDAETLTEIAEAINVQQEEAADRKSEHFKAKAAQKAERMIAGGNLAKASEQDFGRVVKALSENPAAMNEKVEAESLRRIASETLTDKEKARFLMIGGRTAEAVIARLVANPHEAPSILNYATMALGWGSPTFSDTHGGPPHAPVFVSKGSMTVGGIEHVSPPVVRTTKKAAQQAATVHLLASIAKVPMPAEAPVPAIAQPEKPKAKVAEGSANQNPRNRLQEWCAKRRFPLPVFEVTEHGPPHDRTFKAVVTLTIEGRSRSSQPVPARSRKDAEKAAAAAMLATLTG